MPVSSRSSGDLLADRRFAYAEDLALQGDHVAAADLLEQTLGRVPGWAPAWIALGLARERLGQAQAARDAFARGAAHDPAGLYGAALHLARLGGAPPPAVLPEAYVAALFDDYADRFDAHLVEGLGYRGPALLRAALDEAAPGRRFARALDLGCGTGLMGAAIRDRVGRLTGIDLSAAMVAQASRRRFYDACVVADIEGWLAAAPAGGFDLVLAADVFAYFGPLGPVLGRLARVLAPGGLAGFTVQRAAGAGVHWGGDMRFSHGETHVGEALEAAGLAPVLCRAASTRRDAGADIPGLVVLARNP